MRRERGRGGNGNVLLCLGLHRGIDPGRRCAKNKPGIDINRVARATNFGSRRNNIVPGIPDGNAISHVLLLLMHPEMDGRRGGGSMLIQCYGGSPDTLIRSTFAIVAICSLVLNPYY
ncbi:predicted protein [Histoplasma capsulatum var. duboisii H88]|uniref:Predicted protein n=1 Tax=Ajellomyces capsulatus (strain H88) TaxID=544711 RepID=F0UVP9_AJEC8|nr:predicted protein [Histoplasma capsulatum var. duboisii H88]